MSEIGKSVIKSVSGKKIVCSELTVAQARKLLQSQGGDLVDELLLEDIRLIDLPLFTELTADEIDQMLPSDLELVVAGCKEANPTFFRMLAKLASLPKQA